MTCGEKIEEFSLQKSLQWLGLVERMCDERAFRVKAKTLVVEGLKSKQTKKGWKEVSKIANIVNQLFQK